MSYDYAQIPIPDSGTLLRENNTLRLTIDSLHEELQSLKFKSATPHNPFLETQLLSLKSENQQLLNEKNNLLKQLHSPRLSETPTNNIEGLKEKLEIVLEENRRLGDMVIDLKQRNSHAENFQQNRHGHNARLGEEEYSVLQGRIAMLATENERLNRIIQDKDREIDIVKDSSLGNSSAKVVILELENKIVVLGAENERLNAMVNDRNREIETLQLKISTLSMGSRYGENSVGNEGLLAEIERLNRELQEKEREIEENKGPRGSERFSHFSLNQKGEHEKRGGRYDTDYSQSQITVRQAETQLLEAEKRIREIEGQRDDLIREVEVWKEKYRNVLKESKQPEQYESEMKRLRGEVDRLKGSVDQKNRQIGEYESRYREANASADSEKKVAALVKENERVNTILSEKSKELSALQKRLEGYGGIEDKIIGLVTENQRVLKTLNERTRECDSWREKYVGLGGIVSPPRANVLDVDKRVKAMEAEDDLIKGMYDGKSREIDGLKKRLVDMREQVEEWKQKYYDRDAAFLKHSQTSGRLEAKVKGLKEENERITGLLEEKVKQITDLQVKMCSVMELETRLKVTTQERERLETLVDRQRDEMGDVTEKSVRLEIMDRKVKELERQVGMLLKENEDLKETVRDREQEILEDRNIIEELEEKNNKVYKLEEMLEMLAKENDRNTLEVEDKKKEVKEWKERVKELQGRNIRMAELETKVELMAGENERISELLKRKEKMLDEAQLYGGIGGQGGNKRELEETVRWLAEENDSLKDERDRRGREVETLRSRLETRERNTVGDAGHSHVRLSVMEGENERLKRVIEEREEEIKRWRVKCDAKERQMEGERELLGKLRTLQSENGDLKESVVEKNVVIQGIVRKNNELEEVQERYQKLGMEKVIICAELERLKEENMVLRKEKELFEKKEIALGRGSPRGLYEYSSTGSGLKYRGSAESGTGDVERMIDELGRENIRLESLVVKLEKELEYHKKKSLEYEKVETYLGALQGKLELLADENQRLVMRVEEYKETAERLNQRLREKDVQSVSTRFGSREGGGSEAVYGYEHHIDSVQSEMNALKANNYLSNNNLKKSGEIGVYESSVDGTRRSYLRNDNGYRSSRGVGDLNMEKIYDGTNLDSMKLLHDANLDMLQKTLEQQERGLKSIRRSEILMEDGYNLGRKSIDNEGRERSSYNY